MRQSIIEAIATACKDLYQLEAVIELERPDEQFGDYSCNVAMRLAKTLNQNPREIAQNITNTLSDLDLFKSVGVAGPGFINISLKDSQLASMVNVPYDTFLSGLKILIEYSDPNPFKPLHAGHLYTTLVGDVIARLVESAGADVIRLNFGGDVGLHVAKSMWAMITVLGGEYPDKLKEVPETEKSKWMGERYVEGNNAYTDSVQAKSEITALNKRIYQIHSSNDKDSSFAQIYWICRGWSYDYFEQLYVQLQVNKFDRFIPESEVTELGLKTVQDELSKGVFELSDGAVIFDGEKYGLHKRVFINSEGLPTYEAKDVGLSLTKWNDYHFDESIIITASEQTQYMQVVIKAIQQFEPEPADKTKHIAHGVVKLQGGIKMSSRLGNTVSAMDILDSARKAGEQSGNAQNDQVVLAAVKYAFLKNKIGSDITYDPVESIALEGNSGPYLQYAHARAMSILTKSNNETPRIDTDNDFDEQERSLVRKLSEFQEIVELSVKELAPHQVCTYLYELAQTFNRFYEKSKVIGSDRESLRLGLVSEYAKTLKTGLGLLGISAPDSM